ncbi:helix-turn-helix domain-containing protein [Thalassospira lohafexi]|uniref:LacI family transcriptional regulator n=1 Tax=Thalassospira lohafexi TaxID=744227 RepID=A0A2N3LAJ9_9PROT|nr:XRE family transcriptional regulator [Thalassospira lohafexi]PKR59740.1 LacI family transcriptional regulator [Thalassospira lohafexi]
MTIIEDDTTAYLSARLRRERESRGWSLGQFAEKSGVSKAMISKIERGEASPTATVLGRLSGALSVTVSALLSRTDAVHHGVRRYAQQPAWSDPETGYDRRQVLSGQKIPLELVEVTLPAGQKVTMPAAAYSFIQQAIWVLEGSLLFHQGDRVHHLDTGDCLELGPPQDCMFENKTAENCRYLVAVVRSA